MPLLTPQQLTNASRDAQDYEIAVNSTTQETVLTRLGAEQLTLYGATRKMGYEAPVAYTSGLQMLRSTQTVLYSGQTYYPDPTQVPFTTSGTFETAKFRLRSNVTSDQLALPGAAASIGVDDGASGAIFSNLQAAIDILIAGGWLSCVEAWGASTLNTPTQNQTAINNAIAANPGKRIVVNGSYTVACPINLSGDNTELFFLAGAGLTYTTATDKLIVASGAKCKVTGGTITAPASFNATNAEPTYGTIWVTADGFGLTGTRFVNVPKAAVVFKDVNDGSCTDFTIEGNFPEASYNPVNTGHAGIWIDPKGSGSQGVFVIRPRSIKGCVQGVLKANYGPASAAQCMNVTGGVIQECWDHGIYGAGNGNGDVVCGVSFARCKIPVALTGSNNAVTGCTMQTQSTGSSADVCGISFRDAVGCAATGNTIKGDAPAGSVVMNFTTTNGTKVNRNASTGNTIDVAGGSSALIKFGDVINATEVNDNIASGNTVRGVGVAGEGLIQITVTSGGDSRRNHADGNTIVARGGAHGVQMVRQNGSTANGNVYGLEYDAPSAVELHGVLMNDCTRTSAKGNTVQVTAAYGANVTLRAVTEAGGSSAGNRVSDTTLDIDYTKVASAAPFVGVSGSGSIFHETGPGVPNLNAGVGSTWLRTDGGAATTLYVKESGTGATGWVGK